jgi:cell division protein FtsB
VARRPEEVHPKTLPQTELGGWNSLVLHLRFFKKLDYYDCRIFAVFRTTHTDHPEPVTTIWRAVTRLLAWLVVMTLFCIGLAFFKPQLDRQTRIESELTSLKAEKSRLSAENQELKSRLEWLKQDAGFLEVLARDRLDLARKGEVVIHFGEEGEGAR